MKSKLKKLVSLLFIIACLTTLMNTVEATYKITIRGIPSSVKPGDSFTITLSISGCKGGTISLSSSNCTLSKKSIMIDGTGSLKVTAGKAGKASISAVSKDATPNGTFDIADASGSVSFTIKSSATTNNNNSNNNNQTNNNTTNNNNNSNNTTTTEQPKEEEKSKINTLSSLSVNQGTLSPKFSENTTSYNVDVAADVDTLTISAKAKDAKAKVSGTGKKSLEVGKNSFVIKCTAENGSVKSYTLNVNVDEKPLIYTEYNGKKLGVVRNLKDVAIPQSFEETTTKIEDQEVTAYHSNLMEKTIVYLSDENNEKNFYLLEDGKVTSIFMPITILGRNVYQIDLKGDEIENENMTFTELSIDNNKLMGWAYNDPKYSQYSLIMVMNEQGKIVTYQYEKTEDSLQLYLMPEEQEEEKITSTDEIMLRNIFIALSAVLGITCVGLIVYIYKFKKKSISVIKDYYERRNRE